MWTISSASRVTGLNRATVLRLIRDGTCPAQSVDGRWVLFSEGIIALTRYKAARA